MTLIAGDLTAQRRVNVTLVDDAAVVLAVPRRDPANAATCREPILMRARG